MDHGLRQGMRYLPTKQDPDPQEENPTFGITTTPDMKPFSQIAMDLITGLP